MQINTVIIDEFICFEVNCIHELHSWTSKHQYIKSKCIYIDLVNYYIALTNDYNSNISVYLLT